MAQIRRKKNNNNLNSFLNNYFNIFLAVLLIIFLAVGYFIVLQPKFATTLTTIQASIADQQKLYAQEETRLASLRSMADLYKKIDVNDLNKFNLMLPSTSTPEQLFGELEEVISQQGLMISSLSFKPLTDTDNSNLPTAVRRISLDLSLGAIDYRGLKNLLSTLETNLRLFDVTNVSYSPEGSTAQLKMDTYYYQK